MSTCTGPNGGRPGEKHPDIELDNWIGNNKLRGLSKGSAEAAWQRADIPGFWQPALKIEPATYAPGYIVTIFDWQPGRLNDSGGRVVLAYTPQRMRPAHSAISCAGPWWG